MWEVVSPPKVPMPAWVIVKSVWLVLVANEPESEIDAVNAYAPAAKLVLALINTLEPFI